MNNTVCTVVTVGSVLLSIGVIVYCHYEHKRMLKRMNNMLDSAINGDFKETLFSESMLSAVETKLSKYLSSSVVSSIKVEEDRSKIKQLISDISHQTKTPIANILLYSQLLCEQELPDNSKIYVDALAQQAEKLSFLVASLIKTSRLETKIFTLNPKLTDVNSILCNVENQILPKAKARNIAVTFKETDAKAYFDEKWTTEAVYNIVDNAVKYTKANGWVKVSVTSYQLFCRINISDNGIGIPESEQAKVFARFYRSQNVSEEEGVGIGLYVSRQIISSQGGFIKITSETQKGSTFSVFLPMEK